MPVEQPTALDTIEIEGKTYQIFVADEGMLRGYGGNNIKLFPIKNVLRQDYPGLFDENGCCPSKQLIKVDLIISDRFTIDEILRLNSNSFGEANNRANYFVFPVIDHEHVRIERAKNLFPAQFEIWRTESGTVFSCRNNNNFFLGNGDHFWVISKLPIMPADQLN